MMLIVSDCADCVGDAVDMGVCSSSSLTTAAAAASSGQLFMMNLLVHSLMDDNAGLEVALESAVTQQLQVSVLLLSSDVLKAFSTDPSCTSSDY